MTRAERTARQQKAYRRTKEGLVALIYSNQRVHSRNRGHIEPSYSNQELKEWLFNQDDFHNLFQKWKLSGYKRATAPSIDRINDSLPYTFENIKLMTWSENNKKAGIDISCGKLRKTIPLKPVISIHKITKEETEFISTMDASRRSGVSQGHISLCCNGKRNYAGDFYWKFKIN